MTLSMEEMLGGLIADHKSDIIAQAVDKLAGRVAKICLPDMEAQFNKRAHELIGQRLGEMWTQLETRTFPQTNSYGEVKGPPQTLLELVLGRVEAFCNERVDEYGTQTYGKKLHTRLEWTTNKLVAETIAKQLRETIDAAQKEFKQQISAKLTSVLKDTLAKAFRE
jgi:hypothetical protein